MINRTVCWFSCGAASAVATKIAIDDFGNQPLSVFSINLKREHPDNKRFLQDCAKWFGRTVHEIADTKYNADPHEVFLRTGYLVGPDGAACTRILKREVREAHQRPNDRQVFGFTYEEQDRYDRFIDANNIHCDAPLIRHKLTKKDCLAMIDKAGIAIPAMYQLGYKNNNCIGCVKGGAGYWNKIRIDFPDEFARISAIEQKMGRSVIRLVGHYVMVNGKKKAVKKNVPLAELDPTIGRYDDEFEIECGAACQVASFDFGDTCDDL